MPYKTILVHVDESRHAGGGIAAAAAIAQSMGSHLVIVASPDGMEPALRQFAARAQELGVKSFEARRLEGDPATAIGRLSALCDLVVLGQGDADRQARGMLADFIQYVALNCACPVLIVPEGADLKVPVRRALIGWNGSMAAGRALRGALPLLACAGTVEVAEIGTPQRGVSEGKDGNAELHAYMERHGIPVRIVREADETDAGRALLALAGRLSTDLLVMGCVAHPHYAGQSGVRLGGATRAILENATAPVLMAS